MYFMSTTIKIDQNYPIWYISKCLKDMLLKIVKKIVAIFSSLFFSTISKILNIVEFTIVFGIIHH